ncbi:MAG: hypothetical protein C7B45_14720 [Sulfobacillus acidophilus]|uniref:N-acetyltransferase domain-containing protein n=1 Tax=Sulfobacillus acidophilus TaxID=53633 RepID=A0A2T2WE20_9FIRM|nr:MAG: hypothetical protein C7B45_14720 [Sulfobacillus acidophilus]
MIVDTEILLRKIDEMCAGIGMDTSGTNVVWSLPIVGVRARVSRYQSLLLNVVGLAELTATEADAVIAEVIDKYRAAGKIFGWLVGPTSRPADLGERLLAAGLVRVDDESMLGMVLYDLNRQISINPRIHVQEVSLIEWKRKASMIAQSYGFGMTPEVAQSMVDFYESLGQRAHAYFAYDSQQMNPIAFAGMVYDDSGSVVLLGGAATAQQYRGQGIYASMVAQRLSDARRAGAQVAIVQAVKGTSAPICARLGFEAVCEINVYGYLSSKEP